MRTNVEEVRGSVCDGEKQLRVGSPLLIDREGGVVCLLLFSFSAERLRISAISRPDRRPQFRCGCVLFSAYTDHPLRLIPCLFDLVADGFRSETWVMLQLTASDWPIDQELAIRTEISHFVFYVNAVPFPGNARNDWLVRHS